MPRLYILLLVAVIALAMTIVQYLALEYYWYWTYWWLDVAMHIAGGAVIGLLIAAFVTQNSVRMILGVVVIGFLWEVFEFVLGISVAEPEFIFDTALDFLCDIGGALIAYGIIRLWNNFLSPSTVAPDASPGQTSLLP